MNNRWSKYILIFITILCMFLMVVSYVQSSVLEVLKVTGYIKFLNIR